MARCPKLEYEEYMFWSDCQYVCTVTGEKMNVNDAKPKNMCNCEWGYEYEKCPIYQNS